MRSWRISVTFGISSRLSQRRIAALEPSLALALTLIPVFWIRRRMTWVKFSIWVWQHPLCTRQPRNEAHCNRKFLLLMYRFPFEWVECWLQVSMFRWSGQAGAMRWFSLHLELKRWFHLVEVKFWNIAGSFRVDWKYWVASKS